MLVPFNTQKENYTLSSACGTYTLNTVDSTWYQPTNLSASITVSGNKPVFVSLVPDTISTGEGSAIEAFSSSNNAVANLRFKRGSTVIYLTKLRIYSNLSLTQYAVRNPVTVMGLFDFPSAGTHTYTMEMMLDTASTTASVLDARLLVKEFI